MRGRVAGELGFKALYLASGGCRLYTRLIDRQQTTLRLILVVGRHGSKELDSLGARQPAPSSEDLGLEPAAQLGLGSVHPIWREFD